MRRLSMLICAIGVVLGVSDDGCLGHAEIVSPDSLFESLEVSSGHRGSEELYCHGELLTAN